MAKMSSLYNRIVNKKIIILNCGKTNQLNGPGFTKTPNLL